MDGNFKGEWLLQNLQQPLLIKLLSPRISGLVSLVNLHESFAEVGNGCATTGIFDRKSRANERKWLPSATAARPLDF